MARVLRRVAGGGLDEEGVPYELELSEGRLGVGGDDGRVDERLVPTVRQVQLDDGDGQPLDGATLRGKRALRVDKSATTDDRDAAEDAPGTLVGESVADAERREGLVAATGDGGELAPAACRASSRER